MELKFAVRYIIDIVCFILQYINVFYLDWYLGDRPLVSLDPL